jgi:hypothetical protein
MTGERYRLGQAYRNTGSSSNEADQFLRWLNLPKSGMRNMGGIRPFKFVNLKHLPMHAYIVLVTDELSGHSIRNPWEDSVELNAGRITYWGDAKWDEKRTIDDFVGNRAVRTAADTTDLRLRPPILHFSKDKTGFVRFNGLCVIERIDMAWFEDHGRPVRNYRLQLAILSEEFVDVDWLHRRALAEDVGELSEGEPAAWKHYRAGVLDRLKVWAPRIRSQADQIPTKTSPDGAILSQLISLQPSAFEGAVVALFEEMDVVHDVQQTRLSRDGGFDFSGTFTLPPPLDYEIGFRGEVKRYATNYVGPKDVSRLVARLGRGEYGLFVTTSYFSRQAQEEVLADAYPTRLFSGQDVVRMMRQVGAATGGKISDAWIETVQARGTP